MGKKVRYRIAQNSLTASCIKPLAICPLAKFMAPAVNFQVMCTDNVHGRFECTIFIHNKEYRNSEQHKEQILDIMRQICPQCQQHRPKQR